MRILIFSLVYYPRFVGGAEVAVKEITDRIGRDTFSAQGGPALGWDMVTLRTRGELKEETIGNIRVYRVGPMFVPFWFRKYLFPFVACVRASRLHTEKAYDATWSIMANYAGFAALFFKFAHKDVPFILTLQEGDSLDHIRHRVGILYPLFRRIFTKADRIQAISTFLSDWAKYMGAETEVVVIPNGVDIDKFKVESSKLKVEEIRKELGYADIDKVVITTSRLVKKNGVGDLIKAMQYLPENIKLLIIGSGHLEGSLKFKVESLKLKNRVQFLGFVPHNELLKYLHASDIFCRPSLSEGLGISFLEAMAAGLPVVATPVGGIKDFLFPVHEDAVPSSGGGNRGEREINPAPSQGEGVSRIGTSLPGEARARTAFGAGVKYKETGLFCEVENPKSLAEKVHLLLSDDALREKVTTNASKMVRESYTWDFIAKKMKEVLTKRA